jgi:hypothetical protein
MRGRYTKFDFSHEQEPLPLEWNSFSDIKTRFNLWKWWIKGSFQKGGQQPKKELWVFLMIKGGKFYGKRGSSSRERSENRGRP